MFSLTLEIERTLHATSNVDAADPRTRWGLSETGRQAIIYSEHVQRVLIYPTRTPTTTYISITVLAQDRADRKLYQFFCF